MGNDDRFLRDVRAIASSIGGQSAFEYSKEENAYVFEGNIDSFECPSCQSVVTYGECDCGIMWYVFKVFEDNAVKTLAREIDVTQIPKKVANRNTSPFFELL